MSAVECPGCSGLTFTVLPCVCRIGGDRLLYEAGTYADEPYRDCARCAGAGTRAVACVDCGGAGRRRAQLVLTVANLDTGAVASASVVPGSVLPTPDGTGGWELALRPLVDELATAVGVPPPTVEPVWLTLPLSHRYRPDTPADQREALVAAAIAGRSYRPWRVFVGRSVGRPAPPDPARALAQLRGLADLLRLDLVVEARRGPGATRWYVRYEVPGGRVPDEVGAGFPDLPAALAATSPTDALAGLRERGRHAPGHAIGSGRSAPVGWRSVLAGAAGPARVARRLGRLLRRVGGAQAVWRDGRWWYVPLPDGPPVDEIRATDTGQVSWWRRGTLVRATEPPAPSWQGQPIGYATCPDCVPGTRLRRCRCLLDGDQDCRHCSGAALEPSEFVCTSCGDSGRVHDAVTVTLTDLDGFATHELWRADHDDPGVPVAGWPGGAPVLRLDRRYRLAERAATLGVRPADLLDADGGLPLHRDLREGLVFPDGTTVPALVRFVRKAAAGRPGARLIVAAVRPVTPPLAAVLRLGAGLGLDVAVTVTDQRPDPDQPLREAGRWWSVELMAPGTPDERISPPGLPSVEAAVGFCLRMLDGAVHAAVPADVQVPLVVPQMPGPDADPWIGVPSRGVVDPTVALLRLARHYPDQFVRVRFQADGCVVGLFERAGWVPVVRAAGLAAALGALGLRS
ncbi:hypothetical protein AWW66_04045 [Micromonospora rosaria]|uniref:Uncharacterized protein n=1 Tax=Micromonospora rosaria TaxID=47874 RepID=A0A136PXT0_9ACTN|nr:hypothetical protein [Micromonospora rosaria]KXK63279.1 hypothetical protein AWW66_04045 [Micromonospora rosaria]